MEEIKAKVLDKLNANPALLHISDLYKQVVLENAFNDVLDFINYKDEVLSDRISTPIYDLCVFRLNLTGNEGILSSGKGGMNESFMNDIPNSIKRTLRKYRNLP